MEEVADGVYAWIQPDGSWFLNNAGVIVGLGEAAAIDTCSTERRTRSFLDQARRVGGADPSTLINTHHHGDHTNGNAFVGGAVIIGHERCREEMVRRGIVRLDGVFDPVDWGELELAPPTITFKEGLDLWVADVKVELRHFGTAAHTTNDVVVIIPSRRVVFVGDLVMNGVTPFVLMGSVAGSLSVLDELVELEGVDVVVPGHGEPAGPEVIDGVGEYLRFVQDLGRRGLDAGLTPLEAAQEADLGPFAEWADPERLVGNLHRAYAEARGARPGQPIDLARAFGDMVAYNGGRPLRCLA